MRDEQPERPVASESAADPDRQLAAICADAERFARRGWLYATSGNFSLRGPDGGFWMSRSGMHKSELSPGDFVRCDADGERRDPSDPAPSVDTAIHAFLYRHDPAIGCIYHAHHIPATRVSLRDRDEGATRFANLEMLKGFGYADPDIAVDVPILENEQSADAQAERLRAWFDERGAGPHPPGVNVHRHGLYVWGASPHEARRHLETFAYLFEFEMLGTR